MRQEDVTQILNDPSRRNCCPCPGQAVARLHDVLILLPDL